MIIKLLQNSIFPSVVSLSNYCRLIQKKKATSKSLNMSLTFKNLAAKYHLQGSQFLTKVRSRQPSLNVVLTFIIRHQAVSLKTNMSTQNWQLTKFNIKYEKCSLCLHICTSILHLDILKCLGHIPSAKPIIFIQKSYRKETQSASLLKIEDPMLKIETHGTMSQ